LPRREYTKRSDYQVVEVVNRHTLTPADWIHEQDNTKIVLGSAGTHALAREVGVNSYSRITDYDLSAFFWRLEPERVVVLVALFEHDHDGVQRDQQTLLLLATFDGRQWMH
jgi:hypothetical protein